MTKLIGLLMACLAFLFALGTSKTSYQTAMAWLVWGIFLTLDAGE